MIRVWGPLSDTPFKKLYFFAFLLLSALEVGFKKRDTSRKRDARDTSIEDRET